MQLPDANIASDFLKTFGRPERILTCECERSDEPSMTQVLHILNGETLIQKLEAKDNRLSKQLEANLPPDRVRHFKQPVGYACRHRRTSSAVCGES